MKKVIGYTSVTIVISSLLLVAGHSIMTSCNHESMLSIEQQNVRKLTAAPLRALIRIRLEAPPAEVFEYISSANTLPKWMPGLESLSYDHSNSNSIGMLGKGSRRKMMFGDQAEIEEIVQFDRPSLVAYQIIEGVPLRNHLAVIIVEESGDGASYFTWYQYFDIKRSSVSGWFMPFMVRRFLNDAQENLIEKFGGVAVELNCGNQPKS